MEAAGKAIIKLKPNVYKGGDIIKVNLMAMHPMETGMRKDKATGAMVPAHYINSVKFEFNGKVITTMNVWESLSTNPVFTINYKVNGAGELKATFTDTKGLVSEKSVTIAPQG